MDRWEPLRAALAWRVTDGDDEFVERVRADTRFDAPQVLAALLADELEKAGHILKITQGIGPTLAALAKPSCGGRFRQPAMDLERWVRQLPEPPDFDLAKLNFEIAELRGRNETEARKHVALVDRCLHGGSKLFKFAELRKFLADRHDKAWAELRQRIITTGEIRLSGAPVDRGVEGPARNMLRSEVTETMTIGPNDGQLHQGARVWKSVTILWGDFIRCFEAPPARRTGGRQRNSDTAAARSVVGQFHKLESHHGHPPAPTLDLRSATEFGRNRNSRKRGPQPLKRDRAKEAMRRVPLEQLEALSDKQLVHAFRDLGSARCLKRLERKFCEKKAAPNSDKWRQTTNSDIQRHAYALSCKQQRARAIKCLSQTRAKSRNILATLTRLSASPRLLT